MSIDELIECLRKAHTSMLASKYYDPDVKHDVLQCVERMIGALKVGNVVRFMVEIKCGWHLDVDLMDEYLERMFDEVHVDNMDNFLLLVDGALIAA
jgi:hypothetical protein